jgi:hypothetical protein
VKIRFNAKERPRAVSNSDELRPYFMPDGTKLLLGGVLESGEAAALLEKRLRSNNHQRATLTCEITLLGKAGDAKARWQHRGNFSLLHDVWVGQARDCRPLKQRGSIE